MLRRLLPFLVLSLLFWHPGCSDNSSNPNLDSDALSLDAPFGGFDATDEAPGFDDPDLLAHKASDEGYADPILALAEVDSLICDEESGFYHLRLVWGRLSYDSSVSVATDWSGSLTISRGAAILRRVIRFEPGHDYILPRTERTLLEWVSKTTVHNDGIALNIVVGRPTPVLDTSVTSDISPEGDTIVTITVDTTFPSMEPVEVVFETGPYSSTFTLEEISALDTIVYLDDGNAVAMHGLKLDHRPCPRGFLTGLWGHDENGRGVFKGLWVSRDGEAGGYLKGLYGQNEDGENVFRGKWISLSGRFEGFLAGHYRHYPDDEADAAAFERAGGLFRGRIYSANRVAIGVLKGGFKPALPEDGGFFQGRWKLACPLEDETDDQLEGF